jgi:hypothetical protein
MAGPPVFPRGTVSVAPGRAILSNLIIEVSAGKDLIIYALPGYIFANPIGICIAAYGINCTGKFIK